MATVQSLYDELSKQYVGVTMEQIGDSYKIICNNEFTLYVPENFSDLTEAYAFFQGAGGGEGEIEVAKAIEESIKKFSILSSLISLLKNGPTNNTEPSNDKVMMQVPNRSREE